MKRNRRGSSLVRTLLVAATTLAILLVAFSVYQHAQIESADRSSTARSHGEGLVPPRAVRLPSTPAEAARSSSSEGAPSENASSVSAGKPTSSSDGIVGAGRDITMTIYPREGTKAQMQLSVSDWAPKDGANNEFVLRNPEIRMRTRDGNDVRVQAKDGSLEAQRKGPASLDPKRGKLSGEVVIEFDRRSEAEKAALPAEARDKPRPEDLVRIEMDEVQFDLEYDRLWAPGTVKLFARDAEFQAADVEIRFEHGTGRVDSMRIAHGGTITLFDRPERLGLHMPGAESQKPTRMTVADWMRATIEARMMANEAAARAASAETRANRKDQQHEDDGVPVFPMHDAAKESSTPQGKDAVWYLAKFQGDVDARQQLGDVTQSRLQADELEVLRDFGGKEKERAKLSSGGGSTTSSGAPVSTPNSPPSTTQGEKPGPSSSAQPECIVLAWSGYMTLATVVPDGEAALPRARVSAKGNPARVSAPDGEAICDSLTYLPDAGEVMIDAAEDHDAIVRSANQGSMRGKRIRLRQDEGGLDIQVTGPGAVEGLISSRNDAGTTLNAGSDSNRIDFSGELAAEGRREKSTHLDFITGAIVQQQARILDRAEFRGRTKMLADDSSLEADRVQLTFRALHDAKGPSQTVERMHGFGNVVMDTAKHDHLECPELDVTFTTDADGRTRPAQAIAVGQVTARQGERTLSAKNKLIVDFERVADDSTASADSANASESAALANRPAETSAPTRRLKSTGKMVASTRTKIVARRLRADGDVAVVDPDPDQPVEVRARELDCTLAESPAAGAKDLGKTSIETANIVGLPDNPASVHLLSFSVTGERVNVDVPNQWADVPGAGRMTFLSTKDLDGGPLKVPMPIVVTWKDSMKFRGRENRATFMGEVHAASQSTTTFDAQQLLVEFDDAPAIQKQAASTVASSWSDLVPRRLFGGGRAGNDRRPFRAMGKEPAALYAAGDVVAQRSQFDAGSGELASRSRISGPKMSLNLRSDVSRMLIEGAGNLQIEDFRPPNPASSASLAGRSSGDLFASVGDSGPSKTLIEWKELMWYDFSIDQTRFEGAVRLKHLSGKQLEKIFGAIGPAGAVVPPGRATFLNCDVLTADFREEGRRTKDADKRRMGLLSSNRLRQFNAIGSVTLQDQSDGLAVTGEQVTYERAQKILAIAGTPQRAATITTQKPGQMPNKVSIERLFYNLGTGEMQLNRTTVTAH